MSGRRSSAKAEGTDKPFFESRVTVVRCERITTRHPIRFEPIRFRPIFLENQVVLIENSVVFL